MVAPGRGGYSNIFYPLSPRLTVLLGLIFTQGGEEDLYITDYLGDEDAFLIKDRAQALLALDGQKRAALVAAELRRQFQFRGLLGLDQVDPTWIMAALKGEQPVTIGIVLSQLSASTRARILSQLPKAVQDRVPTREELKTTRLEVMRAVRQIFEAKFAGMPIPPSEPTNFYFKDIVHLEGRELMQLVRALGLEELGTAIVTVGRRKLAELCTKLGREAAEELVAAVKSTEERDAMSMKDANTFFQRMVLVLKLDEARGISADDAKERFQRELFQRAGLLRLAKALRGERPSFVLQLGQRLPRTHGRLLQSYVATIEDMYEVDDVKLKRLQDQILQRVEKLAARGKVNPNFLKFTFCYWGDGEEQPQEEQPS